MSHDKIAISTIQNKEVKAIICINFTCRYGFFSESGKSFISIAKPLFGYEKAANADDFFCLTGNLLFRNILIIFIVTCDLSFVFL